MDFIISPLIINQISFLLIFNPSWQVFVLIAYNTCCFEDWRLELPSVIIRERERSACRRIIAGVYRCKHTGKLPHCIECDCFILCDSHNHSPIQKFLVQWYMYVDSMCYQYAVPSPRDKWIYLVDCQFWLLRHEIKKPSISRNLN